MIGHDCDFIDGHPSGAVEPCAGTGGDEQAIEVGDFIVEELAHMPFDSLAPRDGHGVRA